MAGWRQLVGYGVGCGVVVMLAVACGDDGGEDGGGGGAELAVETTVELEPGAEPVALVAMEDGSFLVGERRTGRVRAFGAAGELGAPIAQVAVTAGARDQRGLLGLAVAEERIYAAWTREADGRIVVAELAAAGRERLVWEGPPSSELANGGHLDVLPDGRLVVGIGDLQDPEQVDDPEAPNGKLLALDPAGPSDQQPDVLSTGWNNPFAFVVTRDGAIWVADNAPGDEPERLGRGDGAGSPAAPLPGQRAPSALVELEPGRLGLCGYLDGELTEVDVRDAEPRVGEAVATGCRTGAVALPDDRLAVSDGEDVHILAER